MIWTYSNSRNMYAHRALNERKELAIVQRLIGFIGL